MFSRTKRRDDGKAKANPKPAAAPSLISHDLRVIGDLISDGDLQIDGIVEGDVRSRNVTVGENAVVKGCITAEKARVRGHVEGEITARNVALAKSATVQGDILHESISIEAGAYIDGRCRRFDEQQAIEDRSSETRALSGPTDVSDADDGPTAAANPFAAAARSTARGDDKNDDEGSAAPGNQSADADGVTGDAPSGSFEKAAATR